MDLDYERLYSATVLSPRRLASTFPWRSCRNSAPTAPRSRRGARYPGSSDHPSATRQALQLDKHCADPSCASCHSKIDPPGFALESFDVMGAWRERYRGIDETKPPEKGVGKNGQAFAFHQGLPVDCTGKLPNGSPFTGVRDLKHLLAQDESPLARNLAKQLMTYATGAPIRFSDRAALEKVLTRIKPSHYGIRSLLHAVVQSELFRQK